VVVLVDDEPDLFPVEVVHAENKMQMQMIFN
jgi:hypothetical protein